MSVLSHLISLVPTENRHQIDTKGFFPQQPLEMNIPDTHSGNPGSIPIAATKVTASHKHSYLEVRLCKPLRSSPLLTSAGRSVEDAER
jgi:hypothetical protein